MELRKKCCCLNLFNAIEDKLLDERVSGIFLKPASPGCAAGYPMIDFCPFCGASILHSIKDEDGWNWKVRQIHQKR